MKFSIIIPIHNEEEYLEEFLFDLLKQLRGFRSYEVILVENGSQDGTRKLAREICRKKRQVRMLTLPEGNYGLAVKKGFLSARGDLLVLFDLDYYDISFMKRAFKKMSKVDAVIGTKTGRGASDQRSFLRKFVSRGFTLILKLFFGLKITDTHGIKVLDRKKFLPLIKQCQMTKEMFDTELLIRGQYQGFRLTEIGVKVEEKRKSRSSIIKRSLKSIEDLIKLKKNIHLEKIDSKKGKKLLSVIIPHYQKIDFTRQAVESVLNQEGIQQSKIEIIVCDDDGDKTNNKEKMVSWSPNIVYLINKNEKGPGGNRQTGLDIAKGEFIVFLDSDDQLEKNFIEKSLEVFGKKNVVASVCLSKANFEPDFPIKDKLRLIPLIIIRDLSLLAGLTLNEGNVYNSAFYLCQLSHMVYKKETLKNFKFNHDYKRGGEDWDLVIFTLNKGIIKIIPKKLVKFRYSPQSFANLDINRRLKWKSYSLLASRLPSKNKKDIFYQLFLQYIKMFRGKNQK